jgi:hypothetical protein
MTNVAKRFLYIFLDEAGNLDFSPNGTRYFLLTSVTKERPFYACKDLIELKYDLVEMDMDIEYFHASEDTPTVRKKVFDIICNNLEGIRMDSLIVEKRKAGPTLRTEEKFYPQMLGYLLRYVLTGLDLTKYTEIIVFTDRLPVQRKRNAVEKAVKLTLAKMLPGQVWYRIFHHDSKSNFDLQIADYCNGAIYRKWDRGDMRSYDRICSVVKSEFNIFESGKSIYY